LNIDGVEPAKQTVMDGRYRLRRPVLLLRKHESNPTAEAFSEFSRSKEGQDIVEEMFAVYTNPQTTPQAVRREKSERP
jgi:phosphate transport system substrate-binding protein